MPKTLMALLMLAAMSAASAQTSPAKPQGKAEAEPPATEVGCDTPLGDCTQQRRKLLIKQSQRFTAAARLRPTGSVGAEDRAKLADYDKWLKAQSKAARALAERAGAATTRQIQLAFNQQYLAQQRRMEQEHKAFDGIANIMKAKHDAALKALGNKP